MASTSSMDIEAVARSTLDIPTDEDVPQHYLDEVAAVLKQNPNDTLFKVLRQPGTGFGTAICKEAKCANKQFKLVESKFASDGGKAFGVGSLDDLMYHMRESPKHWRERKARLLAEGIEEDISLAPQAFQNAKSSAPSSKSTTAPASRTNSLLPRGDVTMDSSGNTSHSSSGSSKRKSDVITIMDSDEENNSEVQLISSKPAPKKPRPSDIKAEERDVKPTFFGSASIDRKPLGRNTSNASNVSGNSGSFSAMREDKKPIVDSSSSPRSLPALPPRSPVKPPQNDSGFSSSPSGRERGPEEDRIWREMRKMEDQARQLRNTVRMNPNDQVAGDALLRANEQVEVLQQQMNRLKAGKGREPSTEDDDLPDVRMAASKDGPKPDFSAFLRANGEAGPSSRPAPAPAPALAPVLPTFGQMLDVKPPAAPRISNNLPPMMPGGFNWADQFPAGPQAAVRQGLAPLFAQNVQPQGRAPINDDSDDERKKPDAPAGSSSSEDEADPLGLGAAIMGFGLPGGVGYGVPDILAGNPRDADAKLAKYFTETVSGHDFNEEGTNAIENAAKVLKLSDIKAKLLNTNIVLLPHQILGVAWMLTQEKSKVKGGLLGDAMGLGKTVQMISTMSMNQATSDDKKEKTTLILAPLALLEQWKDEIQSKSKLTCFIFHGTNKPKSKNELRKYDIVLTTTGTLVAQWNACDPTALAKYKKKWRKENPQAEWKSDDEADWQESVEQKGVLFRITWRRIVIDEAQIIRNRGSQGSRAVCSLRATYRWALSGTPLVNELSDYYSLVRFLQVKPWHDWTEWRDRIQKVEKRRPNVAAERAQLVLSKIMLRRNKESTIGGVKLIQLPPKHQEDVIIQLSEEERKLYTSIETKAQMTFSRYLKEGSVMKNYANVLVMLLRLRMLCGHPALIQQDTMKAALEDPDEDYRVEMNKAVFAMGKDWVARMKKKRFDIAVERVTSGKNGEEPDIEECQICYEALINETSMITSCSHIFCKGCLDAVMEDETRVALAENANPEERSCPCCRQTIKKTSNFKLSIFEPSKKELAEATGVKQEDEDDNFDDEVADYLARETGIDGRSPKRTSKMKAIKIDSDEEDELASSPGPRARRAKSKAAKKRVVADSEDDAVHGGGNTDEDDFIDDEDVDEKDRSRGYTKRTGGKSDSEYESGSEAIEDDASDEEVPKKKRFSAEEKGKGRAKATKKNVTDLFRSKKLIPSSKLEATLKVMREAPNEDKFMLLSQWTSMLDLMAIHLDERRIPYVRFQGDMSRTDRDLAVKQFNTSPKKKVLLMSLKAGGVGLNLVGGNRVINLDLAWSPAVENQAFDRVHRLGQQREVYISRIIVEDTVDSRLQLIQERKQLLADNSLGEGKGKKLGKIGVNELKQLFGLA